MAQSKKKSSKAPPICKKCGGKHWPFQPCIKDSTGNADKLAEENLISETHSFVSETNSISKSIEELSETPAKLPEQMEKILNEALTRSENLVNSLNWTAADIMQKEVAWIKDNESVQQGLKKMNEKNVEYLMVGKPRKMKGIVSHSELMGALSPYLKPAFSKWKKPSDQATLQIKIKWIMSQFYTSVKDYTDFFTILNQIRTAKTKCLVVLSSKSKVVGFITVFDIFHCLVKQQPVNKYKSKRFNPLAIIKSIDLKKKKHADDYVNEFLR